MSRSQSRSPFTTLRTEGALLPADLLQRVLAGDTDLDGLTPESYHLSGEKLNEAINRSWNRLQGAWAAFHEAKDKLLAGDPATTVTRERWLAPVLQELGYGRLSAAKALEIDGESYAISHQWNNVLLHLVGAGTKLDERTRGVAGAAKASPHSLVQEVLNRSTERLWGFVSNGLRWRALRDNASLTRQAFVAFDLEAMFAGEIYADFAVFWLVCHQSRVEAERPETCWLEQWSHAAQQRGTRALETLRKGVETAISALGSGFLSHPANIVLRDKLRAGKLDKQDFYRQLLRLVYRLIFLFVAEDRDLLLIPSAQPAARERYLRFYSTARLRRLAERLRGGRHADLYVAVRLLMEKLGQGGSPALGLPELGSFLWSPDAIPDLAGCELANADLLAAVRALAFTEEKSGKSRVRRAVDYKNLGPEELGSVYESLLELHPELNTTAATFSLSAAGGSERKTTGSYYTPSSLIQCLLDSALDPVIAEAMKLADPAAAILALKVCDPACGSGAFLIAAAHRLARRLASVRSGEGEPPPEVMRKALRDVIGRCLYGVDVNPMSVELCKVGLWMEALEPGKPLSFLDHHIQPGNSLIGATPALLARGIPDEAFTAIEGDDKKYCAAFKKQNKKEREGQLSFALDAGRPAWERLGDLAAGMAHLEAVPDDTPAAVRAKQAEYDALVRSSGYEFGRLWADAWCAAFVWKKTREFAYAITEARFREIERSPFNLALWMRDEIRRLAGQYNFFHWHLAFPEVFRPRVGAQAADDGDKADVRGWEGGFDCVLGNPPWDMLQLNPREFFAQHAPAISAEPSMAAREKLIDALAVSDPALHSAYIAAQHEIEASQLFVHSSGRYPLTSHGRTNLMALFAELSTQLIGKRARGGLIVPTGIATDSFNQYFFANLVKTRALVSLYDFENREGLFPGVDSRLKFCLLTIASYETSTSDFVFFATRVGHLSEPERRFTLTAKDIAQFNPNSLTLPVFRTSIDVTLSRKIYLRVPVLVNEPLEQDVWGFQWLMMFLMNTDSALFRSEKQLLTSGYELQKGDLVRDGKIYKPMYEGRMVSIYDHKFATYDGDTKVYVSNNHGTPAALSTQFWAPASEMEVRLARRQYKRSWLFGVRRVARNTDERTVIGSFLPKTAVSYGLYLIMTSTDDVQLDILLFANLLSLNFDYLCRNALSQPSITYEVFKQLPAMPPHSYQIQDRQFAIPRTIELAYTDWDLKPLADDVWREADQPMRDLIQRQWDDNATTTGGHSWDPPAWAEIVPDGCPLPPFKWDEDRRAVLRAELDAYYARLYGLNRKQLRYILDPHGLSQRELEGILDPWEDPTCAGPHLLPEKPALDFPGETFRVLKDKEERLYAGYRTRRLVLEAWERQGDLEV